MDEMVETRQKISHFAAAVPHICNMHSWSFCREPQIISFVLFLNLWLI